MIPSSSINIDQFPRQKTGFHLERMENELLLYHPSETRILYFNQTASLVWELCDGSRSTQAIVDLLCQAYPEAAGQIPADVIDTLQKFIEFGCVEMS
jgi:hypothetical protein